MPNEIHPVSLNGCEVHRLADMAGVHHDLRLTAATIAQLQRRARRANADMLVLEALQASAIVRYGRCFRGGKRKAFLIADAWIKSLSVELQHCHDFVLGLRDKHIAHSVNDWEMNTPIVWVKVNRDTEEILEVREVSVDQERVVLLAPIQLEAFWNLAKTLADRVEQVKDEEQRRLVDHAKQLSAAEIWRRIKEGPPHIGGSRNVKRARGR